MTDFTQYAVALWLPHYEALSDKNKSFLSKFQRYDITTPDETYPVFYTESWFQLRSQENFEEIYKEFLQEIDLKRHSIVGIREDGKIIQDTRISDNEGCDEEFTEILGWKGEITLWNNLSPASELAVYKNRKQLLENIAELVDLATGVNNPTNADLKFDDGWMEVYDKLRKLKSAFRKVGYIK